MPRGPRQPANCSSKSPQTPAPTTSQAARTASLHCVLIAAMLSSWLESHYTPTPQQGAVTSQQHMTMYLECAMRQLLCPVSPTATATLLACHARPGSAQTRNDHYEPFPTCCCHFSTSTTNPTLLQIAVQVALVFAKAARHDFPREWPDLFTALLSQLPGAAPQRVRRTYFVLHHILKELSTKRLVADQKHFAEVGGRLWLSGWCVPADVCLPGCSSAAVCWCCRTHGLWYLYECPHSIQFASWQP